MLLYIPFWVRMWTLSNQPIRPQSSSRLSVKASSRCQTGAGGAPLQWRVVCPIKDDRATGVARPQLHLAAEQHHRAGRAVAFRMPAAAREVPGVARAVGLHLAPRRDRDGALQHHRPHIERMAVLG